MPMPSPDPRSRESEAAVTSVADPTTAALLRARAGDRDAADAFVRATADEVWRLCRYLGTSGHADDLAQETYARAFAGLHRYAGRAPARAWLLGIARHVCADAVAAEQRDRRRRTSNVTTSVELDRHLAGPDHAGTVQLDLLLAGLALERREAFVLTQMLGFSYAEAAAVCRCPVGTIRSRVARARDDLQAAARPQ